MAETNKAVGGEQPKGNQKDAQKETTDPYMNKTPVVGKARPRTSGTSGTKTPSKTAASPSSQSKSTASGSSTQKGNRTAAKASGNQSTSVLNEPSDATTKKVMVSEVSEEVAPIDKALDNDTGSKGQEVPSIVERDEYVQSVAEQLKEGEENADVQKGAKSKRSKNKKDKDSGKGLKKLEKKTIKSEKKLDKMMDKYKKAQKKEVKKSKLILLKEKLLKAFSKLRRRHRKLKAANK